MINNLENIGGASLGGSPASSGNIRQALSALQQNPLSVLRSVGLSVPDNLSPHGIVDYLTQSGQVSGDEINRVCSLARAMGFSI